MRVVAKKFDPKTNALMIPVQLVQINIKFLKNMTTWILTSVCYRNYYN